MLRDYTEERPSMHEISKEYLEKKNAVTRGISEELTS
jgi:hypothetical protein